MCGDCRRQALGSECVDQEGDARGVLGARLAPNDPQKQVRIRLRA